MVACPNRTKNLERSLFQVVNLTDNPFIQQSPQHEASDGVLALVGSFYPFEGLTIRFRSESQTQNLTFFALLMGTSSLIKEDFLLKIWHYDGRSCHFEKKCAKLF